MSLDTSKTIKQVTYNGTVIPLYSEPDYFWIQNMTTGSALIGLSVVGTLTSTPWVEWKRDTDTEWNTDTNFVDVLYNIPAGAKVYLRGNNSTFSESLSNYIKINCSSELPINVGGDIRSLLSKNITDVTTLPDYAFCLLCMDKYVYNSCDLVLNKTGKDCYRKMFMNCINLRTTPKTIHCSGIESCQNMFSGCTSLVTLPTIIMSIFQSRCCKSMFDGSNVSLYSTSGEGHTNEYKISGIASGTFPFTDMFANTSGNITTPSANTTYYTNAIVY